jgi:hypothetical protein
MPKVPGRRSSGEFQAGVPRTVALASALRAAEPAPDAVFHESSRANGLRYSAPPNPVRNRRQEEVSDNGDHRTDAFGPPWVCLQPQDGRKSFDGLAAVVTSHLARDPLSGDLFVFRNKRGDRLRILAWQGDGFVLYLRRLEEAALRRLLLPSAARSTPSRAWA